MFYFVKVTFESKLFTMKGASELHVEDHCLQNIVDKVA